VLEAERLFKSFGALEATHDVSLRLATGARHAIVGPNGSGKTTLFNLLSGELRADSGRIRLSGEDITSLSPDARARRGLTRSFQQNNLFADLTVRENLAAAAMVALGLGAVFWRWTRHLADVEEHVAAVGASVGVEPWFDTPVRVLPYGIQRLVEIGLALAIRPQVVLLDEPTAGMSAAETAAMTALLKSLPREISLVVIEHDMEVVFDLAERITVLDYGRVLVEGTPEEVRGSALVRERYLGRRG
jgi:ABC-type branched-subunit amino acid transport system ATPase component